MIKIEDVPEAEWTLLGKGVKYPENEEWYAEDYEDILENAIHSWKEADQDQREEWIEDPPEFWDALDPALSDDDTDYIKPYYTYMNTAFVQKTSPKYFGPTLKKLIIESVFLNENEMVNITSDISINVRDAWDEAAQSYDLKERYKKGFVTKEFAKFMKPYEKDDEAWLAIETFYSCMP
jgi:hypothetical protein